MRTVPSGAQGGLLVIKAGDGFLVAALDGDVPAGAPAGEGFYAGDTRVLSELAVTIAGERPAMLASSVDTGFRATVTATNPDLPGIARETLAIRRTLLIDRALHLRIELESFFPETVHVPLAVEVAADFADVFDVRGVVDRPDRPRPDTPVLRNGTAVLAYRGTDGITRETIVETDGELAVAGDRVRVGWTVELTPRATRAFDLTATPAVAGQRSPVRPLGDASLALEREADAWTRACTRIRAEDPIAQRVLDASIADLHALLTPAGDAQIPAAGIPWYVVPFGRDSLITALSCLMLDPSMARDTLRVLAGAQSHIDDPASDAEPGKILHEVRSGELARAGVVPAPYYGTVDATPLFLILAAEYWRWTGDLDTLRALLPALDSALEWIDRYGDRDGDGFVEYEQRSTSFGLPNQGWKDSPESTVHADGSRATGPIALVEVQGYVYMAKDGIADVFAALGHPDRAAALRREAAALRDAFHDAFWDPREDTLVLALDGAKQQVASVTSNAGHCLFSGILTPERAGRVADRLMAGDMWSGWGVRTLSAANPAYNPMSYHNGSIWPHDNAIIAAGLKRYGHDEAAARIADAIFAIAAGERDHRIAELYCGFPRAAREDIVPYPVACSPQAWAAAAPFLLLQTTLGLTVDASARTVRLIRPRPPSATGALKIAGLRVGRARASATIAADGAHAVSITEG